MHKPLYLKKLNEAGSSLGLNGERLFDDQDLMQIFHICKRTIVTWRTKGILAYSKIGHKIYYSQSDVEAMLLQNKVFKK